MKGLGCIIMSEFMIKPTVDATREFIEISKDFANPLDLVREAISNAFDARATRIEIAFSAIKIYGENVLKIELIDNGFGMDKNGLQSFFDLGNSMNRHDPDAIGEKGHGTKVYFNSACITVITVNNGVEYKAVLDRPMQSLYDGVIPDVKVTHTDTDAPSSTNITILGYNNNRSDQFSHQILKDHIVWFTKMGSFEKEFGISKNNNVKLYLKGLDEETAEEISFGHIFPEESKKIDLLFDEHKTDAPHYFSKKITRTGTLPNFPYIPYQAIYSIEGRYVKYGYNDMVRRSGYTAPNGAYQIQERYGLWLCKDYMPVQRKNEWISEKGSEFTKFHAFINCQDFNLTANRGSIANTPFEIIENLHMVVEKHYEEITSSDEWDLLLWLQDEADAYRTVKNEQKSFETRKKRINTANVAKYNDILLIEPRHESGVFALFMQLSASDKTLFPFTVLDYDTHEGIDVIAKATDGVPIKNSKLYYVEFKNYLTKEFNHTFENSFSIVCWDTKIKHGETVKDLKGDEYSMRIIPPDSPSDYTRYQLVPARGINIIEVYVLKDYLAQRLNIIFRPRTESDVE